MFYTKNIPNWERAVRIMMAAGLAGYALFGHAIHGTATVLLVAAAMAVMTGVFGFCPMCALVGRKLDKRNAQS